MTRLDETSPDAFKSVEGIVPAIHTWLDDPWRCPPRVLYRIAKDGDRHQIAFHYTWTVPTPKQMLRVHPNWNDKKRSQWLERLHAHEKEWGPGDLELVVVNVIGDMIDSIEIRLKLRWRDAFTTAWRFLRRQPLERRVTYPRSCFAHARPIIVAAKSEHHEWHEPNPDTPTGYVPVVEPFSSSLWAHYQMHRGGPSGRAQLPWEATPIQTGSS